MTADLSGPRFQVPQSVQESQRARDAARNRQMPCAGDAGTCRLPGKHACSRFGGAYCDDHWAALPLTRNTPDPTRTLDGLRARAGLPLDVTPGFHTISDTRAEKKGQRVSAARRATARGDDDPTRARVLGVIGRYAATGQPFSANDVRDELPDLPPGQAGALWGAAVREHDLVEVGRVRSTDPATNGHRIPIWQRRTSC